MVATTDSVQSGVSLIVIEAGLTLFTVALAFCWPRLGSSWFSKVERSFGRLARKRALSVALVGISACLLRLAILPTIPIPKPFIHDEFSFLLAADTFASGRLTNPTHPLWKHFESFHITFQPTYMSMYFPAQGLFLAGGKVLAGHPWFGVLISVGLMCSALTWMFQGWVPPGWALLGGALAVLRLGLFSYWINSYYGGAVAAIGGALVLGALPRVMRRARFRDGVVMALGIGILANSRPYEGVLVCIPVAVSLCWWLARKRQVRVRIIAKRMAPAAVLLLLMAAFIGYYNHRVFGNAFTLAYQVNRATYASAPVFLWQPPRPEPAYRHKVMRDFYTKWELSDFLYARTATGFVARTAQKIGTAVLFIFGVALIVPLATLPWVLRDRRTRFLILAGAIFSAGLSLNAWLFPHYLAPFTGALYVILLQCMRHLRVGRREGQRLGLALVRLTPVLCLALAAIRLGAIPMNLNIDRWPTMWYGTRPLGLARAHLQAKLESYPGRQLAIVRYAPDHAPFDDWVYNAADIDKSKVVWARDMDKQNNLELLHYFSDRKVWLVQPDAHPPEITPYRDPGLASTLQIAHYKISKSH